MKTILTRLAGAVMAVGLAAFAGTASAETYKLKMSIDTAPAHHRTIVVMKWLELLKKESGGQLDIELFHSAQLFNDLNVGRALRQGSVDMAMPGNWVLGGIDPNNDLFLLPMFYGVPQERMYAVSDGRVGAAINKSLEDKLRVKVIGRWLDHGYSDTHSTNTPLKTSTDLKGLRVRSFGGAGTEVRIKALGGDPVLVPWADVAMGLSQGNFGALFSTSNSIASAKLWEAGIKYTLADREFFHQFIPMISQPAYDKLPPDLQKLIVESWEKNIGEYRAMTTDAQKQALGVLAQHGVTVVAPSDAELSAVRKELMKSQDELIKTLKIDPALAAEAREDLKLD
ncbi:TRAP transporter substrate-binding protein DctP [Ancylobacter defluvii]|uniref:C4-dicarboxylate ABC transporter n=1 Tax=Ancylobacter defluvii TaxID=1282440 RepID=A0A9W6NAN0_9HYPH|nr:TRAP transporter substrate-binding protein DctP [Ancylobacter defluvii]MBS7588475.1 TRAP transporter substrate-binding protein DctP [Ancylobacter defluvii]GLK83755.1 C4-dicarboxylate ABC transporter [Ancylobacter defluvii]